jgi:uncharacterized protein YheU (UPF0270 family)
VIISHRQLSAEALAGVIEEYVTRDGTELTEASVKIESVRRRLDRGDLVLVYDAEHESCNILPADEAAARMESAENHVEPDTNG